MTSYHMPADEFRKFGKELIDWLADYLENTDQYPVMSQANPGELLSLLPPQAPQSGEAFPDILNDVNQLIMPGVTQWQSPSFFAYFPANNSYPSILGELLSAGLGVQGMLWATSPACTELETRVLDWLAGMLQLPETFHSTSRGGGVIQDSASAAALTAIVTAREQTTGFQSNLNGQTETLVAYVTSQTHSSVEKAIKIAGIGTNKLRVVETNEQFAMSPEDLEKKIRTDLAANLKPFFVCATIGTTSTHAMDPLQEIGAICQKFGLWLHIDAAMAGTAAICPEYRHLLNGVEYASSFTFNPHKWMFTNFDCNCFFVADRAVLIKALSILPEYLKNKATESGSVFDYRDWQVPLGRRFRALKLWFVIRHYGVQGLQFHIRKHIEIARQLADWIKSSPEFELLHEPPLNLVCFRYRETDDFNRRLIARLNESGKIFLTHTIVRNQYFLRMSIGQTKTELHHVQAAWKLIRETAQELENA